jgi:hypothetical protein
MRRLKKHERNVETLGTDIFELSLLKSHDAHPVILKIWPQASSPLAKFKLFDSSFSLTRFFTYQLQETGKPVSFFSRYPSVTRYSNDCEFQAQQSLDLRPERALAW